MDHSDHGEDGAFKGIFLWLGIAIGVFGVAATAYSLSGLLEPGYAGLGVITDGLILGALFIVMGLGFAIFGVLIGREDWAAPNRE